MLTKAEVQNSSCKTHVGKGELWICQRGGRTLPSGLEFKGGCDLVVVLRRPNDSTRRKSGNEILVAGKPR